MNHLLTFDFEDWNQIAYRRATGAMPPPTGNLLRQTDGLLSLLERHNTQATFFVLGLTAEQHPDLVRRVAAAGHEIASHGYAHLLVHRLSRQQFAEDTRRGKDVIQQICGCEVRGYRAAEFSIRADSLWALEVLAELGFDYDSSIVPGRQRRYGIPEFAPAPARYSLNNGLEIVEIPLSLTHFWNFHWPAGGGCFRLMPSEKIMDFVAQLDGRGPAVTYFHPYEFDSERLHIFATTRPGALGAWWRAARFQFHQNLGRRSMPQKLEALLARFRFTTCANFLKESHLGERRSLLSVAS